MWASRPTQAAPASPTFARTGRRGRSRRVHRSTTATARGALGHGSPSSRRTLVVLGIGVFAIAVWRLRLVVALLFLAFVIAAAMRPGVEALARRRVPRSVSVAVHYLALVGLIALFIWLVVPRALGQVEEALGVSSLPTSAGDLDQAADNSTGVQHELLVALQKRLEELPSASSSCVQASSSA